MDASYDELLAQTSRRTTVLTMEPYLLKTESQRRDWRTLRPPSSSASFSATSASACSLKNSRLPLERSTGAIGSLYGPDPAGMRPPSNRQGDAQPAAAGHHQDRQRR